ncbi:hypothetical protein MPL3356_380097 [Mesorhizobium plurifarium]|uniref:Uncharacterized protein n=1 Tax=Mesorhizobium plurifarium TaxID=69974 RepID=A0A090FRY4_MESPL|nr:hypothetical protein MPL3356_380097 [Mesorhizobium plurifarium]
MPGGNSEMFVLFSNSRGREAIKLDLSNFMDI